MTRNIFPHRDGLINFVVRPIPAFEMLRFNRCDEVGNLRVKSIGDPLVSSLLVEESNISHTANFRFWVQLDWLVDRCAHGRAF